MLERMLAALDAVRSTLARRSGHVGRSGLSIFSTRTCSTTAEDKQNHIPKKQFREAMSLSSSARDDLQVHAVLLARKKAFSSAKGNYAVEDDKSNLVPAASAISPLLAEYARTSPIAGRLLLKAGVDHLNDTQAANWARYLLNHNDGAVYARYGDQHLVSAVFFCDLAEAKPYYEQALGLPHDHPLVKFQNHVYDLCHRYDPRLILNEPAVLYLRMAVILRRFRGGALHNVNLLDRMREVGEAAVVAMGYRLVTAVSVSDRVSKRLEKGGWQRLGEMRYDEPPLANLIGKDTAEQHGSLSVLALRLRPKGCRNGSEEAQPRAGEGQQALG